MTDQDPIPLHAKRDDRLDKAALAGNTKVTKDDWLAVAMDVLVSQGIEQVKVLTLGERLGVSRSSFYWYFKNRQDLLDALLSVWENQNTGAIVAHTLLPADTITAAVCNLFRCFVDIDVFNHQLDFAVREWSRRSGPVRHVVDRSDAARVEAIRAMFERHAYEPDDAVSRARILYYMQIGYYALELRESLETRLSLVPGYLKGFTGETPRQEEIDALAAYSRRVARENRNDANR